MGILTTILSGGLTGLIGNIFNTIFSLKQIKEKNAHERAMADINIKATIEEARANIRVTEAQVTGAIQKVESDAYLETIKQSFTPAISNEAIMKLFENKWTVPIGVILVTLLGLVEALKQFVRPGLTTYLVVILSVITYQAYKVAGNGILESEAIPLLTYMLDALIYMATTAFSWWFGERRMAKVLNRSNGFKN